MYDEKKLRKHLVKSLANHNHFSYIYDTMHDHFYGFAIRNISGSVDDAQDLVSSTFVKIIESLPKYNADHKAKPSSWLWTIHRNNVCDWMRRSFRRNAEILFSDKVDDNDNNQTNTNNKLDIPARQDSDPALVFERDEIIGKLNDAFEQELSDKEKIVVRATYDSNWQPIDKPGKEIATDLGMNHSTYRACLHQAKKHLKNALSGEY